MTATTDPATTDPATTDPATTAPATTAPPTPSEHASTGLAAALKDATREAHEQAENSPFVSHLVSGRVPLFAYTALVAQNYAIYTALEDAATRWADHPVAGPFVIGELNRVPELELDLGALLGPGWSDQAERLCRPATTRYVARIDEVCRTDATAYVAHHYVRYLGDLSGGQVLAAALRRVHDTEVARALNFYRFAAIAKIKPFRDDYRARLDALDLPVADRARLIAEARAVFELNRRVFLDLGAIFAPAC